VGDFMELAERKKKILGAIIEAYIATGEPVGSKFLVDVTGMGLSSATIRNEMSELVDLGFLEQPHTSAGRVPSQQGYRFFVDKLMLRHNLTLKEIKHIDFMLKIRESDLESTLEAAGRVLSQITGCAAVSTTPQDKNVMLRAIELVPAGRIAVMLVMLTSSGVIKSRICRMPDDHTPEMLSFFARLVNEKLINRPLVVIDSIINEISNELYEYTFALSPILEAMREEIIGMTNTEVFLGGEANLLKSSSLDLTRLHEMLNLLEHREQLMQLIEGIKSGVEVRIGTENGLQLMQGSSVVTSTYAFQGKIAGAVGIIGPQRMNYAKMVSNLEYFSHALSKLINNTFGSL
jgi:heat-inducible transcriptional repressor